VDFTHTRIHAQCTHIEEVRGSVTSALYPQAVIVSTQRVS